MLPVRVDHSLIVYSLGRDLPQGALVVAPHGSGVPAVRPVGVCGVPLGDDFAAVGALAAVVDPVGDETQEPEALVAQPSPSRRSRPTRRRRTQSASSSGTCGRTTASSSALRPVDLWTSATSPQRPSNRSSRRRDCRISDSTISGKPAPRCYSLAATIPSWCRSFWAIRR